MVKKNLLVWAMAVFTAANVYGGEPKEPKLLKEIKFDGVIKKFTDNIVVTDKELIFLDKDGNIKQKKNLPDNSWVNLSKNGSRIVQCTGYDITEKGPGKIECKMLDENGNELWKTNKILNDYFLVSQTNSGRIVMPDCYAGGCNNKIVIYDKEHFTGKEITPSINLTKLTSMQGDSSADGNYFVMQVNTWDGPSALLFFDITGNLLWSKHYADQYVTSVAISSSGRYIMAKTSHISKKEFYIYLYDREGKQLIKQQLASGGDYQIKFNGDEKSAVAGSNNGELYFFNIYSPNLLWHYSTGNKNIGFLKIDVASEYVAAVLTTRNPKNSSDTSLPRQLYIFDLQGNLVLKKKFTDHGYRLWNEGPNVRFKESAKKIIINLPNKLIEFENEFAK